MPFNFTRQVKVTTSTNLQNKISAYAIGIMNQRIQKAKIVALDKLKELIVKAIKGSLVYKGLDGEFAGYTNGNDLQAEFGLDNDMAENALSALVNILEETCRIYSQEIIGPVSKLTVTAKSLDPEEYDSQLKTGDEFSYVSKDKHPIDWMLWLLEASTDIVAQTVPSVDSFGISYDLTDTEEARSRSHRAIMTKNKSRVIPRRYGQGRTKDRLNDPSVTANFPYVLPKITLPSVGDSKNFIEDIAKSREFRFMVTNLVEKEIFKVMRPKTPIPGRLQ